MIEKRRADNREVSRDHSREANDNCWRKRPRSTSRRESRPKDRGELFPRRRALKRRRSIPRGIITLLLASRSLRDTRSVLGPVRAINRGAFLAPGWNPSRESAARLSARNLALSLGIRKPTNIDFLPRIFPRIVPRSRAELAALIYSMRKF